MQVGDIYICNVNFLDSTKQGYKYFISAMNGNDVHLLCINDGSATVTNRAVFASRVKKRHFSKM